MFDLLNSEPKLLKALGYDKALKMGEFMWFRFQATSSFVNFLGNK